MVRSIYDQYLSGASLRMIKDRLEAEQIPNVTGGFQWTITAIRSILTNEKYCGDVLLQKTYTSDCISRKVTRNTGQLPMYLVQNHHEGIVERKTFDAVQAEMARRSAGKSPSKKNAPTGMTSYHHPPVQFYHGGDGGVQHGGLLERLVHRFDLHDRRGPGRPLHPAGCREKLYHSI